MTPKDSNPSAREGAGGGAAAPAIGMVHSPTVLAVSGGADSMAMAALALAAWPDRISVIATFDHGTGAYARQAVDLVTSWAAQHGVPCVVGRARSMALTEAAWRAMRWRFLRQVAFARGRVSIATAHTADDQAETVLMRLLRSSGVRGLAALAAPSPGVSRPLLHLKRHQLRGWVRAAGVPFLDDPANDDRRHLRARIRHELLPALERSEPGFRDWLLAMGARAAVVRASSAALVDELWRVNTEDRVAVIPRRVASTLAPAGLGMLWAEAAGRVGVVLDRRGTERLVAVTTRGQARGPIPLSGGAVLRAVGSSWELVPPEAPGGVVVACPP